MVQEVPFHANLLETIPSPPVEDSVCGGRPLLVVVGRGFDPNSNVRSVVSLGI